MFVEVALGLLLVMPYGNKIKQSIITWFDQQAWTVHFTYFASAFLALDAAVFFGTIWPNNLGVVIGAGSLSSSPSPSSSPPSLSPSSSSLLSPFVSGSWDSAIEIERDRILSAFNLVFLLFLYRYYGVLKTSNQLANKLFAMEKQATNASYAYKSLLDNKSQVELELKTLRSKVGTGSGADSAKLEADLITLRKQLDDAQKLVQERNKSVEALTRQAEGVSAECTRLLDENKALREKVQDLSLVMSGSGFDATFRFEEENGLVSTSEKVTKGEGKTIVTIYSLVHLSMFKRLSMICSGLVPITRANRRWVNKSNDAYCQRRSASTIFFR